MAELKKNIPTNEEINGRLSPFFESFGISIVHESAFIIDLL